MAAGTLRLSFPQVGPDGSLVWTEGRPAEAGRTALVCRAAGGELRDLIPAPHDVRSRVHEYGGAAYLLGEHAGRAGAFFVAAADQAIHFLAFEGGEGEPVPLCAGAPEWRYGDLTLDPMRGRLLAVAERRAAGAGADAAPENLLVAIDLSAAAPGLSPPPPRVLAAGADFYLAPTVSPDGRTLAFLAWDHPHMPWDAAALYLVELDERGDLLGPPRHLAGDPTASAQQPQFAPDGTLYFLLEARDGQAGQDGQDSQDSQDNQDLRWDLHRLEPGEGGVVEPVGRGQGELGLPPWQLGMRSWGLLDARWALATELRAGEARLTLIDLDGGARRAVETVPPLAAVSHLQTAPPGPGRPPRAALLAGFADAPSAVATLELDLPPPPGAGPVGARLSIARSSSAARLDPEDVSRAEPLSFPTSDGDQAHGFFYPPRNRAARAPAGERPPLLLLVHGGPTAAASPSFSPAVQFWTTRGFAVFDLNYRGSTGFGRRYRDRLRDQWGVFDVADAVAAARALAASGRVDPARLAIRGGSAGGFTVLAALTGSDVFRAGSSLYGVSDLAALARDTHKFEAHYTDGLVGPWPERADLYAARSPLTHADRLSCPVIFFQGLEDRVVPPDQTERLVAALRAKGLPVEYHAFPGEQHGFRRADTLRAVYEAELSFFDGCLVAGLVTGRGR